MGFFNELKRRNVFRAGFAYLVVAWVVLQAIDFALDIIAAPNWVMQVFFLAAVAILPLVLIFSWVFEMTPEGIKKESEIDRSQSVTHGTGRKLDRTIIVFLALAVVLLLADRYLDMGSLTPDSGTADSAEELNLTPANSNLAPGKSIAVLPFVNMSSDPEQEFFSDGISEEILNVLTRIPGLKVAARTSSFQFKGKNLDIAKIGKQLQVNHVLEGSVRKAGNTLRITAQLIETDSGFHLWSETFDRKLEDVFAIQDEIAAAIADELRTLLTGGLATNSTVIDIAAYELFLKGRGQVAARGEDSLFAGIDTLIASLEVEPQYAPAMATLAKAYAVLPWFSIRSPAGELRERARHWASAALQIEPANAEALAVLAIVLSEVDLNFEGARKLLDMALQASPGNVAANNFRGDSALRTGDLKNALLYESRAAESDPLNPVHLSDLSSVYILKGDYENAISLGNRALALDPMYFHAHRNLANAYFFLGDIEQLKHLLQRLGTLSDVPSDIPTDIAIKISLISDDLAQAQKTLRQAIQQVKSGKAEAVDVAFLAAMAGDFDSAGELLMQAYRKKDGTWIFPIYIRLPEQAPDSEPWQEFWRQPGPAELAELRRSYGFSPFAPGAGEGAAQ